MQKKVKIIGLTDSTIAFNEICVSNGTKLNLHGKESAIVILDNIEKVNEIRVLENCDLIKCSELNDKGDKPKSEPEVPEEKPEVPEEKTETLEEKTVIPEEKTEIPEEKTETPEEKTETPEEKTAKRRRGRPRGAKNRRKAVRRVVKEEENKAPAERTIVVSEDGDPVELGKKPEEKKEKPIDASIEAMEKLQKEEKGETVEEKTVENSELDANQQMGRKATIVVENNKTITKEMSNSAVPESEVSKDADAFIDMNENKSEDKVKDAFIDADGVDDTDDDSFIEV
jgi:hypothetical protein